MGMSQGFVDDMKNYIIAFVIAGSMIGTAFPLILLPLFTSLSLWWIIPGILFLYMSYESMKKGIEGYNAYGG